MCAVSEMHISIKICVTVFLLVSELLCLQKFFFSSIGILIIKLQLSSNTFSGSFYETKLKTTLIVGKVF